MPKQCWWERGLNMELLLLGLDVFQTVDTCLATWNLRGRFRSSPVQWQESNSSKYTELIKSAVEIESLIHVYLSDHRHTEDTSFLREDCTWHNMPSWHSSTGMRKLWKFVPCAWLQGGMEKWQQLGAMPEKIKLCWPGALQDQGTE